MLVENALNKPNPQKVTARLNNPHKIVLLFLGALKMIKNTEKILVTDIRIPEIAK
jgi:hypothetical protein